MPAGENGVPRPHHEYLAGRGSGDPARDRKAGRRMIGRLKAYYTNLNFKGGCRSLSLCMPVFIALLVASCTQPAPGTQNRVALEQTPIVSPPPETT